MKKKSLGQGSEISYEKFWTVLEWSAEECAGTFLKFFKSSGLFLNLPQSLGYVQDGSRMFKACSRKCFSLIKFNRTWLRIGRTDL